MSIELIVNLIQIVALCLCMAYAIYQTSVRQSRKWLLYALLTAAFVLGDLWWILYLALYDQTFNSMIPSISWAAVFIFLIILLRECEDKAKDMTDTRVLWLIPVFTGGMCIYFMQFGSYLSNIIDMVLMTLIMWNALKGGLLFRRGVPTEEIATEGSSKGIFQAAMMYCLFEYAMWTISCLSYDNPLRSLYYVFDVLVTVSIMMFIPALRKAERE